MKVPKFVQVSGWTFLAIADFFIWYSIAANYEYDALVGTYVFHGNGEICTLYLNSDQTFAEELNRSGHIQKTEGQWRRYGEAHMSFSKEFLRIPGEEMNSAGQAHGEFRKTLGIFPSLVLAPLPGGPTFHRKLFR
jgi:hypothetical protein